MSLVDGQRDKETKTSSKRDITERFHFSFLAILFVCTSSTSHCCRHVCLYRMSSGREAGAVAVGDATFQFPKYKTC